MFDILFGWRKASKCKKMVRRVKCRLKFLKIRRDSIVMQLRDEIAQLLKNGHNEIAFSRVEQLYKDQSLLAAYDVLEHFCDFIIIHFPYIRKHKDCPNDINEAVSTLIYAAAWCGDLPELQTIRKLFGERYGHKFTKAAVELCHGSLVNSQIREKLCMKSTPENVKSRLMVEIAKDYNLPRGLLGCDVNRLESHLSQLSENGDCEWERFIFKEEAQVNYNSLGGANMLALYANDRLLERSSNSNPARLMIEPLQVTATHRSTLQVENFESTVSWENMTELGSTATPSEISAYHQFQKSIVNFQEECREDKRTFLFNLFIFPVASQSYGEHYCNRPGSWNATACYGNSYQSCLSQALENNVNCQKCYKETLNFLKDQKFICHQSGHQGKHWQKVPNQVDRSSSLPVCNEKLWSPHRKHICCNKMQKNILSSQCKYNHRNSFCRCMFCPEMDSNCSLEQPCYYSLLEFHNEILVNKCRELERAQVSEFSSCYASCSRGPSPDPDIQQEPFKTNTNSSHSHVHPKLPDYDELAAKFNALKREHQQRTARRSQGLNVLQD